MKIGILSNKFSSWGGGIDFLHHIATSILQIEKRKAAGSCLILPSNDVRFFINKNLYPFMQLLKDIYKLKKPSWKPWRGFDEKYFRNTFSDVAGDVNLIFSGSSFDAQLSMAVVCGVDVVLPCITPPSKDFSLPWVGYIFDFQHRYFKSFFPEHELISRDRDFVTMLHSARHIIVNSRSVIADAEKFFGGYPARLHALPFSPSPQFSWLNNDLDVRAEYGIKKPYFLVCNQFWKHKDHETAFRGFSEFINQGGDALLVCTGATHDYRFPGYFEELLKLISNLKMKDNVVILGHIPKIDQISLVKNALAVIQATLFEGGPGGGAAYDAISLGVPVIASDIPVNLEMNCGDVNFFAAGNSLDLARHLNKRGVSPRKRPSNQQLWDEGVVRKRRCGDFILNVASQAVADFNK